MSSKASAESEEVRVEIVESGPVQRTLQVEVEAVRVRKAFDRAYHQLGRSAQVRGFRRGGGLEHPQVHRDQTSTRQALLFLDRVPIPPDAIELAQVTPISEPEIEGEKPSVDRSFRYTARIEIKPIIELPELTGLPATLTRAGVADEDVERELAGLRDRNAPLLEEPEGTPVAEGHHVEVDFQGRIDGEPFEGGSGKDVVIEIGTNRMIPGFEEQLVGARPGEEREVRVQFPDDYQSEALRGKEALFTVQLKTLRRKQLPDLDDEFAKDLGPFESLENLRERIRTDLLAARQREAQAALHRSLLDVLIERTSFEVPPGLVERRLHSQLASMRRQFEGRVPPETLRAQLLRIEEEGRPAAERRVRESLLLEAVAASEAIEASDDAVDARLAQMAEEQGIDAAQLRKLASEQNWRDAIRAELVERRALDFLAGEAKVEETTDT